MISAQLNQLSSTIKLLPPKTLPCTSVLRYFASFKFKLNKMWSSKVHANLPLGRRSFSMIKSIAFPTYPSHNQAQTQLTFKTLRLTFDENEHIATVSLHRPEKGNSFNMQLWMDYKEVFEALNSHPKVRVCVLNGGESKHFSTGAY